MKRILFLILAFCLSFLAAFAQQKCSVTFRVTDEIEYKTLEDVAVTMTCDDTISVALKKLPGNIWGEYSFEFDYRKGKYTLYLEKEGYETAEHTFSILSYRSGRVTLGTYNLKREREQNLQEATVKATHIKMVMHGDTIVYDAAAFQLAEGSMLDALVGQLPGVVLEDGGVITVYGKRISSLIVNGEDFFSGNPTIALKNLPSYTVKNIKVYDKAQDDDYLYNKERIRMRDDENLVMDVKLKREYSTGWTGNLNAAYGVPDNRYMGKAFLLGYTDKLRLISFVNFNNIKDTQTAGQSGRWGGGWNQSGQLDLGMGGTEYLFKKDKLKITGNVQYSNEEAKEIKKTSTVSYYDSGDIYLRTLDKSTDKRKHLVTSHRIDFSGDKVYLTFRPSIDWLKKDYSSISHSARFSAKPIENYRLESIDSLYQPLWYASQYCQYLLDRNATESLNHQAWLYANASANLSQKVSSAGDVIKYAAGANYRHETNTPLTSYNTLYGMESKNYDTGSRTLSLSDKSATTVNAKASASYNWFYAPYATNHINTVSITPAVYYSYHYNDNDYEYFKRQKTLSGLDSIGSIVPPSTFQRAMLDVDPNNTQRSRYYVNLLTPSIKILYQYKPSDGSEWSFTSNITIQDGMNKERLHYTKPAGDFDKTVSRFTHSWKPSVSLETTQETETQANVTTLSYSYSNAHPDINNLLNLTNDSDPYNVYESNDNLKPSQHHSLSLSHTRYKKETHRNLVMKAGYSRTDNSIAQAVHYNRNTGVTTRRAENINGNWNASASVTYILPLGEYQQFDLSNSTSADFVHSVDFSSETEDVIRSEVNNFSLGHNLSLGCKLGRQNISVSGSASWYHSRSERENFENIDAFNFSLGFSGTFDLPQNWQISTNFSLANRCGYSDATLNETNWVWNAGISKTLLKGKLTLRFDGYDILSQQSSVSRLINAQGNTETWVNSQPRYFLFSGIYRFSKIPKKKK